MEKLRGLEGAITEVYNPFNHVIRSPSPSFNSLFGRGHGLPLGYSLALYGPYKGGKSLICNAMIGQLHRDYPDAVAIKFDTEIREQGQMTAETARMWGLDIERYLCYQVNHPEQIFDRIEHDIGAACQAGEPIKLIVIDSTNGIQGRRESNADSVGVQQIGDHAATIQAGLKRILPIQRKYKFALILVQQVRATLDQLEIKRGNLVQMAAANGLKHHCEYFVYIEPNKNKDGRHDLQDNEFIGDLKDANGNPDKIAHKIRATMKESSFGTRGRMAEFTFSYKNGIINTHEEVFLLATNRGVIHRPNNTSYEYGDRKWVGKGAMLDALRADTDLCDEIVKELRRRDLESDSGLQEDDPPANMDK